MGVFSFFVRPSSRVGVVVFTLAFAAFSSQVAAQQAKEQTSGPPPSALEQKLIEREQQSWEAWKTGNEKYFQQFLSEDHIDVGSYGILTKANIISGIASGGCVVKSYSVGRFRFVQLNKDTAVLTYRAEQDTSCGGRPVPSPVWVTSVYVKRKGQWLNAVFQQSR